MIIKVRKFHVFAAPGRRFRFWSIAFAGAAMLQLGRFRRRRPRRRLSDLSQLSCRGCRGERQSDRFAGIVYHTQLPAAPATCRWRIMPQVVRLVEQRLLAKPPQRAAG